MSKRKLPIGLQTFREIREDGCYYVDKTAYIRRLLDEGKHYFLSRPRRFGKSLFLDTLKELFEGNQSLFEGLYIHDLWDWSVRHPVVRLDFSGGHFLGAGDLRTEVLDRLQIMEADAAVTTHLASASARFGHVLKTLHERTGHRVAVLIDEYDKPILDALEVPEIARANRDFLRGLYATIKASDAHVRFTFITGVSKFSKVSLFSGLNNLKDITLDPRYSAICGYTEADLDTVFAPELPGLDREQIRDWYNGYRWASTGSAGASTSDSPTRLSGEALAKSELAVDDETVYNPFDILLLFDSRLFKSYWFETGTPTFLVETLGQRHVRSLDLDGMVASDELLSTFDVDDIATEALLFQTGYLTIIDAKDRGGEWFYRLGYPNREVRQSLNRSLLRYLVQDAARQTANSGRLYDLLEANDFDGLQMLFHAFFASIPYEWYTNNDIAGYEGYYASVFYSYFASLGLDVRVEDSSSHGRTDMAVLFNRNVYLFEFKVVELASAGAALAQLQARGYAAKYRALGQPIYLIGVEFSKDERNVTALDVERA